MRVCVGGTFDIIHEGHEKLLAKAFEIGKEVVIGLSSDELVKKLGKKAKSYEERRQQLENFLSLHGWKAKIEALHSIYGTATEENFDAIVVSPETRKVAEEINEVRRKKGLKELEIVSIPYVLAEDGIPIATSRIKAGIIKGRKRTKPLLVCIASENEVKIDATKEVFNDIFGYLGVEYESIAIETKKQPFGNEILQGAIKRAKEAVKNADYGVGIEAGVTIENGIYFVEQYVAIADSVGYITYGKSPAFQCPSWIVKELMKGKEMKEIMPFKSEEERKKGAVWYFSRRIDRKHITKDALLMALLPRNPHVNFEKDC